jgi:hypothetical protein
MNTLQKPELSPDFTMEDLYKIREYNSLRWSKMTFEEMKAELDESSQQILEEIGKIRNEKKKLEIVPS